MQQISNSNELYLFALGREIYVTKTGGLFFSRNLVLMCDVQVSVELKF